MRLIHCVLIVLVSASAHAETNTSCVAFVGTRPFLWRGTDPRRHDPLSFRYLVHSFKFRSDMEAWSAKRIVDIFSRHLKTDILLSTSFVTSEHHLTYSPYGVILRETNGMKLIGASPGDELIANSIQRFYQSENARRFVLQNGYEPTWMNYKKCLKEHNRIHRPEDLYTNVPDGTDEMHSEVVWELTENSSTIIEGVFFSSSTDIQNGLRFRDKAIAISKYLQVPFVEW